MANFDLVSRPIRLLGQERGVQGGAGCHYFANLPLDFAEFDDLLAVLRASGFTPDTVIDIGANVGLFSLVAADAFPAAQVHAYEPSPETFAALSANAEPCPRIAVYNLAISDKPGEMTFRPGGPVNRDRSSGAHFVNDPARFDASFDITVPTTTLNAEAARLGLDGRMLVKIDVEGFEYDVFAGGGDLVASPDAVFFAEFNSWALIGLRNMNPRTLLDWMMRSFGFVYRIHRDKGFQRLVTAEQALTFINDNLTKHGCVDDLVAAQFELRA